MTVRVLSYNIHGGRDMRGRRNLARVREMLDAYNVDIAVLQEVETRPSRGGAADDLAALAGPERAHLLPGLAMQEEGGWYGNLIISRFPILRGMVHNLDTAKHLEPRNAVDALIETPPGPLRVIGTHLSLLAAARWHEVQRLISLVNRAEETSPHPMLLTGDINEWRGGGRLLKYLDGHMQALPCRRTFPSFFPVFHLDRAWAHHAGGRISARRLDAKEVRGVSDHLPLLIEWSL